MEGGQAEMSGIAEEMRQRLAALEPLRLVVEDQSESHRGHAGWREGGETHFHITLASARFAGLSRVERQRLVHRTLGDLTTRVHALAMTLTEA